MIKNGQENDWWGEYWANHQDKDPRINTHSSKDTKTPTENKEFINRVLHARRRLPFSKLVEAMLNPQSSTPPKLSAPDLRRQQIAQYRGQTIHTSSLDAAAALHPSNLKLSSLDNIFPSKTPTERNNIQTRIENAFLASGEAAQRLDFKTLVEQSPYAEKFTKKFHEDLRKSAGRGKKEKEALEHGLPEPAFNVFAGTAELLTRRLLLDTRFHENNLEIERKQLTWVSVGFTLSSQHDIEFANGDNYRTPVDFKPTYFRDAWRIYCETFLALKVNAAAGKGVTRTKDVFMRGNPPQPVTVDIAHMSLESAEVLPGVYPVLLGFRANGKTDYASPVLTSERIKTLECKLATAISSFVTLWTTNDLIKDVTNRLL